jgi:HSP20 family protein
MYNKQAKFNCDNMSQNHEAWTAFRKHFGDNISEKMNRHFQSGRRGPGSRKSVNILETDNAYILNLYAAGLKKELFTIAVDEDVLKISYQPEAENSDKKFIYEEYRPMAFERSFKLTDKVFKDQISAAYTDGVLEVTLPKDLEAHKPGQQIEIR